MAVRSITRTALYARISTSNNGQSPEMQLRELREYCQRRGWIIAREYVDTGISGAKDRRPELDRLMSNAHKRRFEVVAVRKFDRFTKECGWKDGDRGGTARTQGTHRKEEEKQT